MPTYADIGKVPKDLLLGTPKSGAFTFDPRLSWTSTTSDGLTFGVSATQRADRIDGSIKVSYAAQNYTADTLVDPSGAVLLNASVSPDSVKGLKVLASALVADPASAKLTLDYSPTREVNVKATTTLTSAPLVDLVGTVEYQGLLLGGEVAFDTAKSNVLRQNIALGYNTVDYQVGAFLTDKATVGKFSYAHSISPTTTVGAEVSRKLSTGDTTFTLGYANKLSNGALAKLKLDSTGLLSGLYETRLASGEKVAGSLQLQGTDLSKPLKYGFAVDLS